MAGDHVHLAGDEGEHRGGAVGDDLELDRVQVRLAGLPIVRVARQADDLVLLELDELVGARADRLGALLRRVGVAGVHGRVAGGEHRQQRRLRVVSAGRGNMIRLQKIVSVRWQINI